MLNFSPETDQQKVQIHKVITDAFGQTQEAELVDIIRNSPNFIPELSLVALKNGVVLGHILFSKIVIETPKQIPALALAPLAITPSHQRQGIGTELVQKALSKCRELNHSIVVVVGSPYYYRRFGFQNASQFGLYSSLPIPDEACMVLELQPSALKNIKGNVCYPPYFSEV